MNCEFCSGWIRQEADGSRSCFQCGRDPTVLVRRPTGKDRREVDHEGMGGGVKKVIAKSVENRERIRPLAERGLDSREIAARIRLGLGETESFVDMIRTDWP